MSRTTHPGCISTADQVTSPTRRAGGEGKVITLSKLLLDVRAYVTARERAGLIAPTTAKGERNVLSGFALAMGERRIEQIGRTDILAWLATISHLEKGTRAARFRIVRRFFEDVLDRPNPPLRRNPCRGIKPPPTPKAAHRALSHDQVRALLAAAPDDGGRLAILLGVQAGLRVSEAANVQLGDLDWRPNDTTGRIKVVGKGGHARIVPMPGELRDAAERYLLGLGVRWAGPLLRQRRFPAKGVSGQYLSDEFREIAFAARVKRAAGDGVSFHALRHTCATDVYRACKDILIVRDLLGHSDVKTTDGYTAGQRVEVIAEASEGRTYSTPQQEAA
jgi:integrase/recombinase XerD